MAEIPQGNFVALQPLTPVKYTNGDIYLKMVEDMIKRGDVEKAAALKAKQDKVKNAQDLVKTLKDPTYSQLIASTQKAGADMSANYVQLSSEATYLTSIDPERSNELFFEARKLHDQLSSFQNTFNSENKKQVEQNIEDVKTEKSHMSKENYLLRNALSKGVLPAYFNKETGVVEYTLPSIDGDGDNYSNGKARVVSHYELLSMLKQEPDKNLVPGVYKGIEMLVRTPEMQKETETGTDTKNGAGHYDTTHVKKTNALDEVKYKQHLMKAYEYMPNNLEGGFVMPKEFIQIWEQKYSKKTFSDKDNTKENYDMILNDLVKYGTTQVSKDTSDIRNNNLNAPPPTRGHGNGGGNGGPKTKDDMFSLVQTTANEELLVKGKPSVLHNQQWVALSTNNTTNADKLTKFDQLAIKAEAHPIYDKYKKISGYKVIHKYGTMVTDARTGQMTVKPFKDESQFLNILTSNVNSDAKKALAYLKKAKAFITNNGGGVVDDYGRVTNGILNDISKGRKVITPNNTPSNVPSYASPNEPTKLEKEIAALVELQAGIAKNAKP